MAESAQMKINQEVDPAREETIAVVGLGYVGLPLVREFTRGGAKVVGFDIDAKKVKALAAGKHVLVDKPLTVDDYMNGRMMSDPLCLFDCDMPIDGSVAFVVSRSDSQAIDRKRALAIEEQERKLAEQQDAARLEGGLGAERQRMCDISKAAEVLMRD